MLSITESTRPTAVQKSGRWIGQPHSWVWSVVEDTLASCKLPQDQDPDYLQPLMVPQKAKPLTSICSLSV